MNAERLLEAFNRLGDEPETVQQFRKLVVGLATSGKLVAPAEQAFKDQARKQMESLGGEFFQGDLTKAQIIFASIPGVSRFGR